MHNFTAQIEDTSRIMQVTAIFDVSFFIVCDIPIDGAAKRSVSKGNAFSDFTGMVCLVQGLT